MNEEAIIAEYLASPQNLKARTEAVNALRHFSMDKITFTVKDNEQYMLVYDQIMMRIARVYPSLAWEVKRQMAKKNRRNDRRDFEQR